MTTDFLHRPLTIVVAIFFLSLLLLSLFDKTQRSYCN